VTAREIGSGEIVLHKVWLSQVVIDLRAVGADAVVEKSWVSTSFCPRFAVAVGELRMRLRLWLWFGIIIIDESCSDRYLLFRCRKSCSNYDRSITTSTTGRPFIDNLTLNETEAGNHVRLQT